MPRSADSRADEGAWLEAVALFEAIGSGQRQTAARMLHTTVDPSRVTGHLMSLIGVLLRGMDATDIGRFVEAARRAGPPPPIGQRLDQSLSAHGLTELNGPLRARTHRDD